LAGKVKYIFFVDLFSVGVCSKIVYNY